MGVREFPYYRKAVETIADELHLNLDEPAILQYVLGMVHALLDTGEIILTHKYESLSAQEHEFQLGIRNRFVNRVTNNPDEHLVRTDEFYMAGGALPTVLGLEKSEIWKQMLQIIKSKGEYIFVNQSFTGPELIMIGNFARYLESLVEPACVDDRLDPMSILVHGSKHGVHCQCGACKDVERTFMKVLGESMYVEDQLCKEKGIGTQEKQRLLPCMDTHKTSTMLVSTGTQYTLHPEKRAEARYHYGLMMHACVPIQELINFTNKYRYSERDRCILIDVWIRFNIGAAKQIMLHHNDHAHHVEKSAIAIIPQDAVRGTVESGKIGQYVQGEIQKYLPTIVQATLGLQ